MCIHPVFYWEIYVIAGSGNSLTAKALLTQMTGTAQVLRRKLRARVRGGGANPKCPPKSDFGDILNVPPRFPAAREARILSFFLVKDAFKQTIRLQDRRAHRKPSHACAQSALLLRWCPRVLVVVSLLRLDAAKPERHVAAPVTRSPRVPFAIFSATFKLLIFLQLLQKELLQLLQLRET